MAMNGPDHNTLREWVSLDADGLLPNEDRDPLEEHLASCPECRRERDELCALSALLERSAIPVRDGFRDEVMSALPSAGWEGRAVRAWRLPVAVFAALALAAVALLARTGAETSGLAPLVALAEMFGAAALAGAGLLAASWKGVGLLFEEVLTSPGSLAAFGVFVLCLNLLLLSLIRRRRAAAPESGAAVRSTGRRER
jgi:anti-sigma factor RsiW